ncbi:MAG: YkgJ family cysteine cluster protein [Bacteroidota bacterium]
MNLIEKSQAVLKLFEELEQENKEYRAQGGMTCVSGCGKCCASPKVSASPLEFLPLAFDFYSKGIAEVKLKLLEEQSQEESCLLFRKTSEDGSKGYCTNYAYRGMICRLFGSAARRNKSGRKELITCKILKEEKNEEFLELDKNINADLAIPMATNYYSQLNDLDQYLSASYPINEAIQRAIEVVLRVKHYEEEEQSIQV